ncbi:nitric oxide synthase, inducible-like [Haliotis rufescens]|uniref:nitric oxide synthase, inducible-like n=1 Tax=Haliotis rufescens TaxID=6454 RepID=UPI00201F22EF|nr:nitric oxide synthase, inducible-like [Haliotis rufescens]XP_048242375.1 nitric oxide synthase, inducible-like [Haliotis rufescens]
MSAAGYLSAELCSSVLCCLRKRQRIPSSRTEQESAESTGKTTGNGVTLLTSTTNPDISFMTQKSYFPNDVSKTNPMTSLTNNGPPKCPVMNHGPTANEVTSLRNYLDGTVAVDTLHEKQRQSGICTNNLCMGSTMLNDDMKHPQTIRSREGLLADAEDFLDQYYTSLKSLDSAGHMMRWAEVKEDIAATGTYDLTLEELAFGVKTAWRNAPRCIGRIQWSKLKVMDARHVSTTRGMFEAICSHLEYGTNNGNLRSTITVFAPRRSRREDFRVWNNQLILYAGYRQPDGSVIGDPANVEFTEICEALGWRGKGGVFDVLPLVLSAAGGDPEVFDIPEKLVLEVEMKHPKYAWFEELGLKWFVFPGVSKMVLDCGGLEFPAVPFNGWYLGTEVGARNFCDAARYNMTEKVAIKMGLNTENTSSLWRDRALVEVNIAVLHSFQSVGATIVDHHTASESFIQHLHNEQRQRGGCPADWVWVVPPMSGSQTEVFHQEMTVYKLKPSYEYQEDAWTAHVWKNKDLQQRYMEARLKRLTQSQAKAVASHINCVIVFATETGRSERFARRLCQTFKRAFTTRVVCMEDIDLTELQQQDLILVVTSTFGNGDGPENGETFAKSLEKVIQSGSLERKKGTEVGDANGGGALKNIRYGVFGLGSRAYPNFCAFGHFLDSLLGDLGGQKILETGEGDELSGQENSFKTWARRAFKASLTAFNVDSDMDTTDLDGDLSSGDDTWTPGRFRIAELPDGEEGDLCTVLGKLHNKHVEPCKVQERRQLQSATSPRQTILVRLGTNSSTAMKYSPGDHVAIFPSNSPAMVEAILSRLHEAPSAGQIMRIEVMQEETTARGTVENWVTWDKVPSCSLRTAFTRYLDITTPPTQDLLKTLSTLADNNQDRDRLDLLTTDSNAYEEWRDTNAPTLLEVLKAFPSLRVPASLLVTQLPLLKQRYYSISSSPDAHPDEVHATVAVLKYTTEGGIEHEGVCSGWLNKLEVGQVIPCAIRAAPNFRLPEDKTLPVMMVGPGTGIAPFRSFWQQRQVDLARGHTPTNARRRGWGDMRLYFGCRSSSQDHVYDSELAAMKDQRVLKDYYVALSREPGQPKMYVQHMLQQYAKDVYNTMVKAGGHIYVCGDVEMAEDVRQTLERILSEQGNLTPEAAREYIRQMRSVKRYHEDIFGVLQKKTKVETRSPVQTNNVEEDVPWIRKITDSVDEGGNVVPVFPSTNQFVRRAVLNTSLTSLDGFSAGVESN